MGYRGMVCGGAELESNVFSTDVLSFVLFGSCFNFPSLVFSVAFRMSLPKLPSGKLT